MTTAYAWAPITKVEEREDGTVLVSGPATDGGLDRDKQRMDQTWLDGAMPRWMAEGGNVREMHQRTSAVGVATGLSRRDDGTHDLTALVVDPVAVKKVQYGVLQGFSVGIKDPRIDFGKADAPNGVIVGGDIIEVSLVDRPANPRTKFMVAKADAAGDLVDADAELEELEDEDAEDGNGVDDGDEDDTTKADQIAAVLADVAALVPDLNKADAASDVADAKAAIAAIGRLIASEATSMADGQDGEDGDICCLLDAVKALKFFIAREQAEVPAAGDGDGDGMPATTDGDALDISGGTYMTEPTESKTDAPDLTKGDTAEIFKSYGERIAAVETQGERIAALEEQLNKAEELLGKVLALPRAGGPAAMRTASDAVAARAKDTDLLKAQAAEYLAKANECRQTDPDRAAGYMELRRGLLAKADA